MKLRAGKGFDLHRLETGLPLILGGIQLKYDKGCIAHSDGDVLIHALIDSLLGASGKGDIGTHFPDTDPSFKGISGEDLLCRTLDILPPLSIVNIDLTVFCEQPKIGPYREEITSNIARILNIEKGQINIKGKTMEQTGIIGEGKAIAADAVVLLELKGD